MHIGQDKNRFWTLLASKAGVLVRRSRNGCLHRVAMEQYSILHKYNPLRPMHLYILILSLYHLSSNL